MKLNKYTTGLATVMFFAASMAASTTMTTAAEKDEKVEKKIEVKKHIEVKKQLHKRVMKAFRMDGGHFNQKKVDYTNIVSTEKAMAAAEKSAKGKATSVSLMSHGAPTYVVKVATSNGVKTVKVAADTGKVIPGKKDKNAGLYDALRGKGSNKLKVDLDDAMKLAQKEVKGRVTSARLLPEPGNMAFTITVEGEDGTKTVMISGSTGKVLSVRDGGSMWKQRLHLGDVRAFGGHGFKWQGRCGGQGLHLGGGNSFVFSSNSLGEGTDKEVHVMVRKFDGDMKFGDGKAFFFSEDGDGKTEIKKRIMKMDDGKVMMFMSKDGSEMKKLKDMDMKGMKKFKTKDGKTIIMDENAKVTTKDGKTTIEMEDGKTMVFSGNEHALHFSKDGDMKGKMSFTTKDGRTIVLGGMKRLGSSGRHLQIFGDCD